MLSVISHFRRRDAGVGEERGRCHQGKGFLRGAALSIDFIA